MPSLYCDCERGIPLVGSMISAYLTAAAVVIADLLTKVFIAANYEFGHTQPLVPGILNITNVSNDGIAFGWLDNARWLFMLTTAVLIVALVAFLAAVRNYSKTVYMAAALVFGGGIGNFIDRIVQLGVYDEPQCVVDFIDFCAFPNLWKWTFNIADAAICIGIVIFAVYLLFFDKRAHAAGLKSVLYDDKKDGKKNGDGAAHE